MNLLSTDEAAALKRTTRQVILGAIHRGEIDIQRIGKRFAVRANERFAQWQLSKRHVKAGRARWAKERAKKN